jgi:soluble lytic murein transglycosylase
MFLAFVAAIVVLAPSIWRFVYPLPWAEIIERHALDNDLDPLLIAAVIKVESNFNPNATSPKDARGLMQILPSTGSWVVSQIGLPSFSPESLYDPDINVRVGSWYLRHLLQQFKGNLPIALAAYNGGSGNVQKWIAESRWSGDVTELSQIPFPETRHYVWKVLRNYEVYQELYKDRIKPE